MSLEAVPESPDCSRGVVDESANCRHEIVLETASQEDTQPECERGTAEDECDEGEGTVDRSGYRSEWNRNKQNPR